MSLSVSFDAIEKQFGPVHVLHGVSFALAARAASTACWARTARASRR